MRCPVLVARAVLLPAVLVLLCWFFAINEIAACACLAWLRGRFGIDRPRTKSSASPGLPLTRKKIAAPGAFWCAVFFHELHLRAWLRGYSGYQHRPLHPLVALALGAVASFFSENVGGRHC